MWYLILALLMGIYLLFNIVIPSGGTIESYLIRPLIWLGLAFFTYYLAQNEGLNILKLKKFESGLWEKHHGKLDYSLVVFKLLY